MNVPLDQNEVLSEAQEIAFSLSDGVGKSVHFMLLGMLSIARDPNTHGSLIGGFVANIAGAVAAAIGPALAAAILEGCAKDLRAMESESDPAARVRPQ